MYIDYATALSQPFFMVGFGIVITVWFTPSGGLSFPCQLNPDGSDQSPKPKGYDKQFLSHAFNIDVGRSRQARTLS